MAQRPIWRGHLRLALVSCPVALYTARHERNSIRFNMINPKTGNRIKMVTQDAETGEPLSRSETVKGYEFTKNRYVIITDEDMESVKVESSGMMTIEKFVAADSIDAIYYDASYYLAPDGKAGDDVYAVLREAIEKTGRVALSRVVIGQRERTIALRPIGRGLVAHTLIERQTSVYDPADLEDRYETRLRAMLEAKLQGEEIHEEVPVAPTSNVIDLMAALRKSLGEQPKLGEAALPVPKSPGKRAQKAVVEQRKQPGLKLPIEGGKKSVSATPGKSAVPALRQRRRTSS
jgi:DNA end-binding protein Ku